jgi:hypothetical protein
MNNLLIAANHIKRGLAPIEFLTIIPKSIDIIYALAPLLLAVNHDIPSSELKIKIFGQFIFIY